jgi:hypothetical protein
MTVTFTHPISCHATAIQWCAVLRTLVHLYLQVTSGRPTSELANNSGSEELTDSTLSYRMPDMTNMATKSAKPSCQTELSQTEKAFATPVPPAIELSDLLEILAGGSVEDEHNANVHPAINTEDEVLATEAGASSVHNHNTCQLQSADAEAAQNAQRATVSDNSVGGDHGEQPPPQAQHLDVAHAPVEQANASMEEQQQTKTGAADQTAFDTMCQKPFSMAGGDFRAEASICCPAAQQPVWHCAMMTFAVTLS